MQDSANLLFRGLMYANTYASSIRSRVSHGFQIDSSYTCGRAKMMRKRYEWMGIFFGKRRKKVAFSNEYGYVWTAPKPTDFWTFSLPSLPSLLKLPDSLSITGLESPFN